MRYLVWTAAICSGAILRAVDHRLGRWPVCGILLVGILLGGVLMTRFSRFSFGSSSHYMEGVLLAGGAGLALIGYVLVSVMTTVRRAIKVKSNKGAS